MNTQPLSTKLKQPDREDIRAGMKASREAFHNLLSAIPAADWRRKSVATAFTVAELFEHIVHGVELIPDEVEAIRQGKNYLNFPLWFTSKVNLLMTRRGARKSTPQSIAQRYDAAHAEALNLLDTIQDDEWHKGAHFFGEGYWTMEFVFRGVISIHFEEHAAQIQESLSLSQSVVA
jgi:hypothetical protein